MMNAMVVRMSDGARTPSQADSDGAAGIRRSKASRRAGERERWAATRSTTGCIQRRERAPAGPQRSSTRLRGISSKRRSSGSCQLLADRMPNRRPARVGLRNCCARRGLDFLRKMSRERAWLDGGRQRTGDLVISRADRARASDRSEGSARHRTRRSREHERADLADAVIMHDMVGCDLREMAKATETTWRRPNRVWCAAGKSSCGGWSFASAKGENDERRGQGPRASCAMRDIPVDLEGRRFRWIATRCWRRC